MTMPATLPAEMPLVVVSGSPPVTVLLDDDEDCELVEGDAAAATADELEPAGVVAAVVDIAPYKREDTDATDCVDITDSVDSTDAVDAVDAMDCVDDIDKKGSAVDVRLPDAEIGSAEPSDS